MNKQKPKLGITFVTVYIVLVVAALIFLILMLKKTPFAESEKGVRSLLLTFGRKRKGSGLAIHHRKE